MRKNLILIIGAALLSGALGCSKSDSSSGGGSSDCDAVGSKVKEMVTAKMDSAPPQMKDKLGGVTDKMVSAAVSRCKTDKWSKAMIDCVKASDPKSSDDKCDSNLTPDQKKAMDADMEKIMTDALGDMK
jgi:hypothetical protein